MENAEAAVTKEVGTPETGSFLPIRLCPDAPGFLNLMPGLRTRAQLPRQLYITVNGRERQG